MTTAAQLLEECRKSGLRIAVAESCTGGMVAAAITDVAGSSDVFECGFVTYSNDAKSSLLGVCRETLSEFGAVSEPVAKEMAIGSLRRSGADLTVSVTGIAGPGGSEFKPEGRVCFAVALRDRIIGLHTVEFGAPGRENVRIRARDCALNLLYQAACAEMPRPFPAARRRNSPLSGISDK